MINIPSYDLSMEEISGIYKEHLKEIVLLLRKGSYNYPSHYSIAKGAIECAFQPKCVEDCSHFAIVFNRLALIDNVYSTNMRMRPYGLGELAEVITMLGTDELLANKFLTLVSGPPRDFALFDYLKSQQRFYKDGSNEIASNLFSEKFGVEGHRASKKKALSLITKYAYYLTKKQFPIFDSLVQMVYPRIWNKISPETPIKRMPVEIGSFIDSINKMRTLLGNISYDELDFILWHLGKIINDKYASILTMEDYLSMPSGFSIKTSSTNNLPFLNGNPVLLKLFELASLLA